MSAMTLSQSAVEAAKKVLEDEFSGTLDLKDVAERMLTAALAVDGVVLVPKEPTEGMMAAGGKKADDIFFRGEGRKTTTLDAMKDVWSAMLTAANDGEERK
jgi:hypothetical protein